jgi:hypothetical protein
MAIMGFELLHLPLRNGIFLILAMRAKVFTNVAPCAEDVAIAILFAV